MYPRRLYKYLPAHYLQSVLNEGKILFRNLTYFQQIEDTERGDPLEALHRDKPDNCVRLTNVVTGKTLEGDFSFVNRTNPDLIFAFCLSGTYSEQLCNAFKSNACIEIIDVEEFIIRIKTVLRRTISCDPIGLLHGHVNYYAANKPTCINVKQPEELVFAKNIAFISHDEYRLVFGLSNAFVLTQSIICNHSYNFKDVSKQGIAKEKTLAIGSINDIAIAMHLNV